MRQLFYQHHFTLFILNFNTLLFAISKLIHNFAVRKVGLFKVRMDNLLNNNASKLIHYSNLKNKQWLKKSLKW